MLDPGPISVQFNLPFEHIVRPLASYTTTMAVKASHTTPLEDLIRHSASVVIQDDNAKSHAQRTRVTAQQPERKQKNRWESSPSTGIHKSPPLRSAHKRALPSSAITSLKTLVAPLHAQNSQSNTLGSLRQRTIPLPDFGGAVLDYDDHEYVRHHRDQDDEGNDEDVDDVLDLSSSSYASSSASSSSASSSNLDLQQECDKLQKASQLLSEYLRVATEELCLDAYVGGYNGNDDDVDKIETNTSPPNTSPRGTVGGDDDTVTTATLTIASASTAASASSQSSQRSLTRNVKKPVRQRSREDVFSAPSKPIRRQSREGFATELPQQTKQ